MTRTLRTVLEDARTALMEAGLSNLDWTMADVIAARATPSGRIIGELGWRSRRVRFACVDSSVTYRLEQNGTPWKAGLSGCFALRLVIHPRFGFQAEVYDVLTESLGQATSAERIAAICQRIERERWTERQRRLPDPGVPQHLAVVSSPTAQGLNDFLATVEGVCQVTLVKAQMAGDLAARSVATAIRRAALEAELVVVLRGGGAASTMEWADDERVVEAIATAPRPVWVAVGHADDRHLIDVVAQKSFATPTQAAAELRRREDLRVATQREHELRCQRQEAEREALLARRRASVARRVAVVAVAALSLLVAIGTMVVRGAL